MIWPVHNIPTTTRLSGTLYCSASLWCNVICVVHCCSAHNRTWNHCIFLNSPYVSMWPMSKKWITINMFHISRTLPELFTATYDTYANNYNECHLKTELAFQTEICIAKVPWDWMPFKKGQINIALLPHGNTAVVPFLFLLIKLFWC